MGIPYLIFPHHQNCAVSHLEQPDDTETAESDASSIDLPPSIDWDINNDEYDTFDKLKGIIKFTPPQTDANCAAFSEEVDYVFLFTLHLLMFSL